MPPVETRILREPWEVDARLAQLGLNRDGLLKVRDLAMASAADATPFHAANAAGTFAYHYAIYGLRDGFVGDIWDLARPNGVEVIRNISIKVMVGFSNVDIACKDEPGPKPRSEKGAGAERVGQMSLFAHLPQFAPKPEGAWALYYLMVDQDGAAELSLPVVKDGTFIAYIERLWLSNGDDPGRGGLLLSDDGDPNNFDPQVIRKAG